VRPCPAGLYFDPKSGPNESTSKCDYPYNVICDLDDLVD
jgi:hypothetical protein